MNLVLLVLALSVIGVFVIGSAEPDNQSRQIIGLAFGLFVMVIVSLIDYVWLMDFYWLIYGFVVLILGAVLVIGTEVAPWKEKDPSVCSVAVTLTDTSSNPRIALVNVKTPF